MSIDSSDDFDIADTVHRRDAHHRPGNSITRVSHEPRNFWNQQEKPETMLALLRPPLPQRPQDASTSGPPSRRTRSRERRSPPIELGERAAERPVDLVYNPSQGDKNMTVQLMMDIEEDWAADLEAFCRLRRLGRFKDAKEHFKLRLEHLSSVPIIWLQYAEMLLACGDHKAIEASTHPPELVEPSSSTVPCSAEDQVLRTYQLFNLLWQSRHRPPSSIFAALRTVHRYRSSTEIQLLCSCLRVLHHIGNEPQHGWPSYDVLEEIRLVDFRQIYCNVVGDRLIWDFRDLFVALASLFGWETASTRFFGSLSDVQVLDTIAKDWGRPFFEEGSTMGLLDLFTSLILQNPSGDMKSRNLLLLQRAQALVESIQRNDPDLMRSRPFTRYLLAKAVCEMNVPPQRPNEGRLGDFKGFAIDQGPGIHLPICVPGRHFRKPSWGSMFFSPATVEQRRVVEVAAGAAHHAGDHRLHADALKLLAFQSDDPSTAMDALARLQLDTQGDRNGYVATCLSRFNVSKKGEDEMNLLRDLDRVDRLAGELHFEEYVNDYLRWAWIIIRILLVAASRANSAGSGDVDGIAAELFANETAARKWKFPPSVMNFSRGELGIPAGQERPHAPLPPPWSWERDGISVLKYGASHDSDTPIYSTRHVKFAGARRPPPPPPRLAPPHRAAIYTWHDDSDSDSDSDSDLLRTYSEHPYQRTRW
ncbi:hypothetical protein N658DRAFT_227539 [Parathielavia hyrcaniae]|uniref:Uncharacterized protein n=1 Tax=Parathielavia hyrcaniae TaxID=113614 RepID=A0AAN6PY52_9PEZI|nr:hypothetical protein N658DRAFT_227539 [Parathielavia hyrcaniae]